MEDNAPVVRIQGLPFASLGMKEVVSYVAKQLSDMRGGWIVTPNLDILRRWSYHREFRDLVKPTSIFTADGMSIIWLSKLLGTPLPERVAGSDLFLEICDVCAQNDWSVFFLGGNPGAADGAKLEMEKRFPGLRVVGVHCPPFGFEHNDFMIKEIIDKLSVSQPRFVFVGLGCPKQEELIAKLRPIFPSTWWAGIGITFSFVCGDVHRAPMWMRSMGFEWLHRLIQEPTRLFHRYIINDGPFLMRAGFSCIVQRLNNTQIEVRQKS